MAKRSGLGKFIAGALVGVGLGVLFAPKKGSETRADLKNMCNDLIDKAGGLIKDADTSMINLSKKIEDEMIIIIYSKSEVANFIKTQDETKKKLEICENKLKNDACIKENQTTSNGKININEASISELESLNGIGKSKAEAIVEYRKKSRFKSIDEKN